MSDLNRLFDARDILAIRQKHRPFWGNLKIMRDILETTVVMVGNDFDLLDLYDLMTYDTERAAVTFDYAGTSHRLELFRNEGEIVYQFGEKWFHGAEDFLENARIDSKRITTVMNRIVHISVN